MLQYDVSQVIALRHTIIRLANKLRGDLCQHPRLPLCATTDHHSVSFRQLQRLSGGVSVNNIAVSYYRNVNGRFYGTNCPPIRRSLIELTPRATMNRDHLHACFFRPFGNIGSIQASVIPPKAHLQRHGQIHSGHNRLDQRQSMIGVFHQSGAGIPRGHLLGGTPHVNINNPRALIGHQLGAFGHPVGLAPRDLYGCSIIPEPQFRPRPR